MGTAPLTQTERIVLDILRMPDLAARDRTLPRLISRTGLESNTLSRALTGLERRDLVIKDVEATLDSSVWFARPVAADVES